MSFAFAPLPPETPGYQEPRQEQSMKSKSSDSVTMVAPLFSDAGYNRGQAERFLFDAVASRRRLRIANNQNMETLDYEEVFAGLSHDSRQTFIDVIDNNFHWSELSLQIGFRKKYQLLTDTQREARKLMQEKCKNEVFVMSKNPVVAWAALPLQRAYMKACNAEAGRAERELAKDDAVRQAASVILRRVFLQPATVTDAAKNRIPGLSPTFSQSHYRP